MEHIVIHDEKVNRFEVFESAQIAYLQYSLHGNVMDMYHTFVPPALEGRGIGAALVKHALDFAREHSLKVIPSCSFVAVYIRRHQEYEDLTA